MSPVQTICTQCFSTVASLTAQIISYYALFVKNLSNDVRSIIFLCFLHEKPNRISKWTSTRIVKVVTALSSVEFGIFLVIVLEQRRTALSNAISVYYLVFVAFWKELEALHRMCRTTNLHMLCSGRMYSCFASRDITKIQSKHQEAILYPKIDLSNWSAYRPSTAVQHNLFLRFQT